VKHLGLKVLPLQLLGVNHGTVHAIHQRINARVQPRGHVPDIFRRVLSGAALIFRTSGGDVVGLSLQLLQALLLALPERRRLQACLQIKTMLFVGGVVPLLPFIPALLQVGKLLVLVVWVANNRRNIPASSPSPAGGPSGAWMEEPPVPTRLNLSGLRRK
jgi:hypothetical protein